MANGPAEADGLFASGARVTSSGSGMGVLKKSGAIVGATSLSARPSRVQSGAAAINSGAMVRSVEEFGGGVKTDVATADTDLPQPVQRTWSADVLAPQCGQFMTAPS
jgi:hypothetical protein